MITASLRARTSTAAILLWGASIGAWLVLAQNGGAMMMAGAGHQHHVNNVTAQIPFELTQCAAMVIAMMAPTLAGPFLHLWFRSLSRHRTRALILFSCAYLSVWVAASSAIAAAIALVLRSPHLEVLRLAACGVALGWQLSELRAHCISRCHSRPRISVFGAGSLLDPIRFGITIAFWCVGTCWALMALPQLWPGAQYPLLVAATVMIGLERSRERLPRERANLQTRFADCWWMIKYWKLRFSINSTGQIARLFRGLVGEPTITVT